MQMEVGQVGASLNNLALDPSHAQLLLLGLLLLTLCGSMTSPVLFHAIRKMPWAVAAIARRVWAYIVDKIIESIIVGIATLLGVLWLLEAPAKILR
jgi:hypothetical protein